MLTLPRLARTQLHLDKGKLRKSRTFDAVVAHPSSVVVTSIESLALGQQMYWSQKANTISPENVRLLEKLVATPGFDPPPEVRARACHLSHLSHLVSRSFLHVHVALARTHTHHRCSCVLARARH